MKIGNFEEGEMGVEQMEKEKQTGDGGSSVETNVCTWEGKRLGRLKRGVDKIGEFTVHCSRCLRS